MKRVQVKEFKNSLQAFVRTIQEEVDAPKTIVGMAMERARDCTFIQVMQDPQSARLEKLDDE